MFLSETWYSDLNPSEGEDSTLFSWLCSSGFPTVNARVNLFPPLPFSIANVIQRAGCPVPDYIKHFPKLQRYVWIDYQFVFHFKILHESWLGCEGCRSYCCSSAEKGIWQSCDGVFFQKKMETEFSNTEKQLVPGEQEVPWNMPQASQACTHESDFQYVRKLS